VRSPPFWIPSLSGKWLHLATTCDVAGQRVTHFLDAEVLHTESIPDHQLVRTTHILRSATSTVASTNSRSSLQP